MFYLSDGMNCYLYHEHFVISKSDRSRKSR